MSYTQSGLVGSVETFSQTIGALIKRDWLKANTNNVKPKIIYDENRISNIPTSRLSGYITIDEGVNSGPEDIESALDDSQTGSRDDVIITVNAVSKIRRLLMEREIYRILRANRPLNGTKIKKSDNTNDSAILGFDFPLPKFTRFNIATDQAKKSEKSQMLLTVHSQEEWA